MPKQVAKLLIQEFGKKYNRTINIEEICLVAGDLDCYDDILSAIESLGYHVEKKYWNKRSYL